MVYKNEDINLLVSIGSEQHDEWRHTIRVKFHFGIKYRLIQIIDKFYILELIYI